MPPADRLTGETEKFDQIRPNPAPIRTKLTMQSNLILDDIRSSRSTQGRRPKVNDYEDTGIDNDDGNESQRA
jgi:hypothetical protein